MDQTPESHIVFGKKGNSKPSRQYSGKESNSQKDVFSNNNLHNKKKIESKSQNSFQFESFTRDEDNEDFESRTDYDEEDTQQSVQILVESAQRLKEGFSNLDSKISDLKYIAKSIKKQYDIYKATKEATEQAKTSNVFSQNELNEFIKVYQKEKDSFLSRMTKGNQILQDLRQSYATKQSLLRQFTENKIMDATFLKSCEKDLQKSETDITKYTKIILFYQNLLPKPK